MTWAFLEPAFGDMIRVKSGDVYHYGVFLSEGEVWQFGKNPSLRPITPPEEIEVLSSDIADFLAGGFLEVACLSKGEKKACRAPEAVAAYLRARRGEKGYHILYHNCEHLATAALFGKAVSLQASAVLQKDGFPRVYLAVLPEKAGRGKLYPKERDIETKAIGNERLRREKHYVWKLLEYAIFDAFGLKMKQIAFTKDENGKWHAPNFSFSISHGGGALAVALSTSPIGVDIEATDGQKSERLLHTVLSESEKNAVGTLIGKARDDCFYQAWTRKEAIFKKEELSSFNPSSIESLRGDAATFFLTLGDKRYALSVAADDAAHTILVPDINL